jgi:hypothetical protein
MTPNKYYTAFLPYIIFMGCVYEPRHSVCPEQFLPVVPQNMEAAKAALGAFDGKPET